MMWAIDYRALINRESLWNEIGQIQAYMVNNVQYSVGKGHNSNNIFFWSSWKDDIHMVISNNVVSFQSKNKKQ